MVILRIFEDIYLKLLLSFYPSILATSGIKMAIDAN